MSSNEATVQFALTSVAVLTLCAVGLFVHRTAVLRDAQRQAEAD